MVGFEPTTQKKHGLLTTPFYKKNKLGLVLVIYNIDEFSFGGSYFWSTIMISVGIFTLSGEF